MSDYIIINDDLRTMQIPSSITLLGVESDDDVNKIQFQMPKTYCGFDLSAFSVRVNYMNANGDGDIYIADDVTVDGDNMTFTWLVGRNACKYKGNTKFIVCLKLFEENSDIVIKEFNTTVYNLPVLEGLETTDAVEQQNADIIEYLINLIEQSGGADLSNYYTKQEVDALIPTELPNPKALTINGNSYDGSQPVDLTIEASSEIVKEVSGKVIHINDAVADEAVQSLKLYDSSSVQLASGEIAIANKNLFRIDELAAQVVSKGITFTKNADGSITCNGTSTGTYPMTSCTLDKNMFEVGRTYCLSSGKTSGFTYVQLIINYTDNTTDYIVARNSARAFTISKEVESCTGSVQLTDSGVTISNEVVYPMLEIGSTASAFVNNTYFETTFDGTVMPVLPAAICNVWANDDVVANMVMEYEADTVLGKVDDYANDNLHVTPTAASVVAQHDGARTVALMTVDEAEATLDIIDQYVEDKKEEIDEYIAEVEGELGETVAEHTEQIAAIQDDTERLHEKTNSLQKQIDNITEAEDLLKTVDYPSETYGQDTVPANVSKYAEISGVNGKTRAWNQLIADSDWSHTYTVSSGRTKGIGTNSTPSQAHVYLISVRVTADTTALGLQVQYGSSTVSLGQGTGQKYAIFTGGTGSDYVYSFIHSSESADVSLTVSNSWQLHDLTDIFGAGNEPSTVAEALALLPALGRYDSYNAGSLVDAVVSAVESVGVNLWDEDWVVGALQSDGTVDSQSSRRTTSFIPVKPNTDYYQLCPFSAKYGRSVYYDANKNLVAYNSGGLVDGFTTPDNAYFLRITFGSSYGTTYNNDIQISLDSSSEKTTYHAYHEPSILELPEPVTLRSAGTSHDVLVPESGEITRKVKRVNLGDYNWTKNAYQGYFYCSLGDNYDNDSDYKIHALISLPLDYVWVADNAMPDKSYRVVNTVRIKDSAYASLTADQFKTAMDGIYLVYELATPTTESIDPIDDPFVEVESGGTIRTVQDQTPEIDSCLTVTYVNKVTA